MARGPTRQASRIARVTIAQRLAAAEAEAAEADATAINIPVVVQTMANTNSSSNNNSTRRNKRRRRSRPTRNNQDGDDEYIDDLNNNNNNNNNTDTDTDTETNIPNVQRRSTRQRINNDSSNNTVRSVHRDGTFAVYDQAAVQEEETEMNDNAVLNDDDDDIFDIDTDTTEDANDNDEDEEEMVINDDDDYESGEVVFMGMTTPTRARVQGMHESRRTTRSGSREETIAATSNTINNPSSSNNHNNNSNSNSNSNNISPIKTEYDESVQSVLKQLNDTERYEKETMTKVQVIGQEFICVCCMDIIIQATSIVPCGHTFCNSCIFQSMACTTSTTTTTTTQQPPLLTCPTCRVRIVSTLPARSINNTIQSIIALQEHQHQHQQQQGSIFKNNSIVVPTITTNFFSIDDIKSYHERIKNAVPERTYNKNNNDNITAGAGTGTISNANLRRSNRRQLRTQIATNTGSATDPFTIGNDENYWNQEFLNQFYIDTEDYNNNVTNFNVDEDELEWLYRDQLENMNTTTGRQQRPTRGQQRQVTRERIRQVLEESYNNHIDASLATERGNQRRERRIMPHHNFLLDDVDDDDDEIVAAPFVEPIDIRGNTRASRNVNTNNDDDNDEHRRRRRQQALEERAALRRLQRQQQQTDTERHLVRLQELQLERQRQDNIDRITNTSSISTTAAIDNAIRSVEAAINRSTTGTTGTSRSRRGSRRANRTNNASSTTRRTNSSSNTNGSGASARQRIMARFERTEIDGGFTF